jgi:hypothetical protein
MQFSQFMQNFDRYSNTELIDLLSAETANLAKLLNDPISDRAYQKSKLFIRALTKEIEERKMFTKPGTVNHTNESIKPD